MPTPFASRITHWQRQHGRLDLPWQHPREPYRVWLSEVMLQQTQVATVIPYFERFVAAYPTVRSLAAAPVADVMRLWAGLGYYSRARNLHKAAQQIVAVHGGTFPQSAVELETLPGVGRSTAAAIASLCFDERVAILDGNVKRVLARHGAIEGWPGNATVSAHLWQAAAERLPARRNAMPAYTQGLMDLGALVCTARAPRCNRCPVAHDCAAHRTNAQANYPAPRPKQVMPTREVDWWLVQWRGRLLVELRPATGLWGGLYALPESPPSEQAAALNEALPEVRHSFTHFKLVARPRVMTLSKKPRSLSANQCWIGFKDLQDLAWPAPIARLVKARYVTS